MPPFEVLLPLGAVGLYLLDSAALLYSNELLLVPRRRGWDFTAGSRLLVFGRALYLPNPLTPHVPLFRVRWSDADHRVDSDDAEEVERFVAALRPVQYLTLCLLVLILALPLELMVFGTGVELLTLFAVIYLVIFAALSCVYVRRRDLRVTAKTMLMLCLDSLACAPFAINLVRKLAARRSLSGNPLTFARNTFGVEAFTRLIRSVCDHVDYEQQYEEEGAPRWFELEAFRKQLVRMLPCQPSN